jgi:pimeloyl-ACP methyl ester carboxylesterase
VLSVRSPVQSLMTKSGTLQTPLGPIEYAEVGQGPPILYFHGTGAGYEFVFPVEKALVDAGFRLIVPNRPGYFGTDLAGRTTPADCARLANDLLDGLGIAKAAVMATSGGGPSALSFASIYANRTTALVLQCSQTHQWADLSWWPDYDRWIYPFTRSQWSRHILYRCYVWRCRISYRQSAQWIKTMAGSRFDEIRNDPATWDLYRVLRDTSLPCLSQPAGMRNDFDVMISGPYPDARDVKCPTLVIYDPADPLVPVCHPQWALSAIRGAQACELHAGGHLIWLGRDADRMRAQRVAFLRMHAEDSH